MNSDRNYVKKSFRQEAAFELGPEGQVDVFSQGSMNKERTF